MFESKEAVLEAVYGKWGRLYRKRLIERDREKYYSLLAARELHDYISKIDVRAEHLYDKTLTELKAKKRITPSLKKSNPTLWQKRMTGGYSWAVFSLEEDFMRLDKYLKVSRIIKRRTVANEACSGGRVSLNGKVAKAGAEVKVGDTIAIRFGDKLGKYEVVSIQETVKKDQASEMYRVLSEDSGMQDFRE